MHPQAPPARRDRFEKISVYTRTKKKLGKKFGKTNLQSCVSLNLINNYSQWRACTVFEYKQSNAGEQHADV